jgi:streptomycin 6-kinase
MIEVPAALEWWRERPDGAEWLARLPAIAEELASRWRLELGPPFPDGIVSLVVPAERDDGTRTVLKVNFPERETEHEADALALWNGRGAATLLERDDHLSALLVERVEPGEQLWSLRDEDAANQIAAGVLATLRTDVEPDAPFHALVTEAQRWAEELPQRWERLGRPIERSLVQAMVAACRDLSADDVPRVLLHQDFHGGNVLRSRDGWLAIDPKPLAGDPAFDTASLLRDRRGELRRDPQAKRRVRRRLDLLADRLEFDRERMRLWGVVHALAWGVSEDFVHDDHISVARFLMDA